MIGLNPVQMLLLGVGVLGTLALLAFSLLGPDSAKEGARRLQGVRLRHSDNATDKVEAQMRKALASRRPTAMSSANAQSRTAQLLLRLHRTGREWTLQKYLYLSGGLFAGGLLLGLAKFHNLGIGAGLGAVLGLGLPHMIVGKQIARRGDKFVQRFPDAVELLVRGLRSGLPVTETLAVVSHEIPGPVGQEFKQVTERIRIGRSMEDALQESAERMNMAEFNFFCITLAIQRETGGNLAETLSNLADVLRKRAQMKLKVKAMSSESKASAYIVGSLPFIVFGLVYWVNPNYLGGFFYEPRLMIAGGAGLVWMGLGVLMMAKMINFEI